MHTCAWFILYDSTYTCSFCLAKSTSFCLRSCSISRSRWASENSSFSICIGHRHVPLKRIEKINNLFQRTAYQFNLDMVTLSVMFHRNVYILWKYLMGPVRLRYRSHPTMILPPSPVILWIELGGKLKWLPLNFGYRYHDKCTHVTVDTVLLVSYESHDHLTFSIWAFRLGRCFSERTVFNDRPKKTKRVG